MVSLKSITKSISAVALAIMLTVAPGNGEAFTWVNPILLRDGVVYEDSVIADRNRNPINIEAEKYRVETMLEISTQDKKGRNLTSSTQKTVTDRDGNVLSDVKYKDKWIEDRSGRPVDIESEKYKIVETHKTIIKDKKGNVLSEAKSIKETLLK